MATPPLSKARNSTVTGTVSQGDFPPRKLDSKDIKASPPRDVFQLQLQEVPLETDGDRANHWASDYCDNKWKYDFTDPKDIPFKTCSVSILAWPSLGKEQLLKQPFLLERLKKGIETIEANRWGRVDTYQKGDPCNAFHVHLLMDDAIAERRGITPDKKEEIFKLLVTPESRMFSLLYHTEELTFRFHPASGNRNIVQAWDGSPIKWPSPSCIALYASDLKSRNVLDINFALVEPDHPFYAEGHPLKDGRRFIAWISQDMMKDLRYKNVTP